MVLGVFLTGFTPYVCAEKKEQTYAMVVFLNGSEFFNWAYAGMADAAKLLGEHVKVELHGPKDWDATLEAKAIIQLSEVSIRG